MATSSDIISGRAADLKKELDASIKRHTNAAMRNHWCLQALITIAILSSIVAGLGGITLLFINHPRILGTLALMPGIMAFIAGTMKFQDKASRHARYKEGLRELRQRLVYQLPEFPTADNVAAIAADLSILQGRMQKEREALAFNFAQVEHRKIAEPNDRN
jgi:hypothetical protein